MKFLKKFLFFILLLLVLAILFRGFLFRNFVKYNEVGTRGLYIIEEFEKENFKSNDINSIIDESLKNTAENLQFKLHNPGNFSQTGNANCIGYADYFSSYMHHILMNSSLKNNWKVSHKIGKIEVLGLDVHQFFNSPSFKDHDFVVIKNVKTGEKIAVDPTVYDYFKINRVSLQQ